MTQTIHIELDSVRVYRNKSEGHTKPRARSSLGHEITGYGQLVPKMIAILQAENPEFDGLFEICRGSTPVVLPTPLKSGLKKRPVPDNFQRNDK